MKLVQPDNTGYTLEDFEGNDRLVNTILGNNAKIVNLYNNGSLDTFINRGFVENMSYSPTYIGKEIKVKNSNVIISLANLIIDVYKKYAKSKSKTISEPITLKCLHIYYSEHFGDYTIMVHCYSWESEEEDCYFCFDVDNGNVILRHKDFITDSNDISKLEDLLKKAVNYLNSVSLAEIFSFSYITKEPITNLGSGRFYMGFAEAIVENEIEGLLGKNKQGEYSLCMFEEKI